MIDLCSVLLELSKYDSCQSVFFCTCGTLISNAIQANQHLVLAEIKGYLVRNKIVGKLSTVLEFHKFHVCE